MKEFWDLVYSNITNQSTNTENEVFHVNDARQWVKSNIAKMKDMPTGGAGQLTHVQKMEAMANKYLKIGLAQDYCDIM